MSQCPNWLRQRDPAYAATGLSNACRIRAMGFYYLRAVFRRLWPFSRAPAQRKIASLQSLRRVTVSPLQINGENGRKRSLALHPLLDAAVDRRVEHARAFQHQLVLAHHLFGRRGRADAGKDRPAAGHAGIRPGEIEGVVADRQEQAERLGAAD